MKPDRNVVWILALETLWALGTSVASGDIQIALMSSKGAGATLVAVISILGCFLVYFPQLFVPWFQQRVRHCIGGAALGQGVYAASYFVVLGALIWVSSPRAFLAMLVVAAMMAAMGNALNVPFYQQMRLRLYPARTRSRSYSTVIFSVGVAGALGAWVSIPLMNAWNGPGPRNYTVCYAVGSLLCAASTCCFLMLRDPNPTPPPPERSLTLAESLRELRAIWRDDRNVRMFTWSECANWLGSMGSTFFTFYAVQHFGQGIAAECGFARTAAMLFTVPLGHWLMTRWGPRSTILGYYAGVLLLCVLMALPPARATILLAFAVFGLALMFRLNYIFHFITSLGNHADKTRYYAICNAVISPFTILGPLLGRWFLGATHDNYRLLFAVSLVPFMAGAWIVWRHVKDPSGPEDEIGAMPRSSLKRMLG